MKPENLRDPFWRLRHLYKCKKEGSGEALPFRMRPEQEQVIRALYDHPGEPVYIVKARRLGLSTGIGLAMMDHCAWNGGAVGRLIERNQDFAGEKMRDIMRFGFESMPKEITSRFDVKHQGSPQILDPKVTGLDENKRSMIHAGIAARGGDCSWLWVSEWGPIAHKDPTRSEEIRTGAFPAARLGKRVVETTWMGGKSGDLWELIKPIYQQEEGATGTLLFFPWWNDPVCVRLDGGAVDGETEGYFRSLSDTLSRKFQQEQKRWYVVAKKESGIFIKREYPSTIEEALSAPVEGAIYAKWVQEAHAKGRVLPIPVDGNTLVHTFWDLGSPKNTRVWYVQVSGMYMKVLRVDMGTDETIAERWARMLGYGYNFGKHYLPHDAKQTERLGKSMETSCRDAGMQNVVVLPPCSIRGEGIWYGINHMRGLFASFMFDSVLCADALDDLQAYHTDKDNDPVHDPSSHTADAGRTLAEAHAGKLFKFDYADNSFLPTDHSMYRDKKRRGVREIRYGG